MGVYAIPAALNSEDRDRQANIIPLTLGPLGSSFDSVVKALQSLDRIDRGVESSSMGGAKLTLCVPILCFIGDMPQQDKNSGFRGPKAHKFCRGEDRPTLVNLTPDVQMARMMPIAVPPSSARFPSGLPWELSTLLMMTKASQEAMPRCRIPLSG